MRLKTILLTFLLTACSSDDKPENLIPEDKMAKALAEIHILEAEISNLHLQHEDSSVYVYQKIKVERLKALSLDSATFGSSFKYYLLNPEKMKGIYAEVKKLLEARKKTIENLDKIKKKREEIIKVREIKKDSTIKSKLIIKNKKLFKLNLSDRKIQLK